MQPGLSTHVFLEQRLGTGLLETLQKSGAETIQIFAARHHFDYCDRSSVREIANWFRSNNVGATMHQPLYADTHWSRHLAPTLNLIDVEKARRIEAMDEVKRAMEAAEQIPMTAIVLHLGLGLDQGSPRSLEHSLTAIEHLKAFAHPLGMKVLLENLANDVSTPEHLMEILKVGHFDNVGICLDVGHAHMTYGGVDAAFEACGKRIVQMHLHDNHGTRDEHLWPESGTIDWAGVVRHAAALGTPVAGYLEIAHDLGETEDSVEKKASKAFSLFRRLADAPAVGDT